MTLEKGPVDLLTDETKNFNKDVNCIIREN